MAQGVTVDFNANLARFTSAIDKATNDLTKFQSNAERVGKNVSAALSGLAVALPVAAIAAYSKWLIDAADNVGDLSAKIGISVKDLGQWQLVAESSGASLETIGTAIKGLAPTIQKYAKDFEALGVSTKDPNQALIDLADVVSALPSGFERAEFAQLIFKKTGMDMLPILSLGSKGIEELRSKADEYAKKLAELQPAADQFNDNLKELELNAKAGKMAILNDLLPAINDLLSDFMLGKKLAGGFVAALRDFGTINPFKSVGENLKDIRKELELINAGKESPATVGMNAAAVAEYKARLERQKALLEFQQLRGLPTASYSNEGHGREAQDNDAIMKARKLRDTLRKEGAVSDKAEAWKDPWAKILADFKSADAAGLKALNDFRFKVEEDVIGINETIAELGLPPDDVKKMKGLAEIDKDFDKAAKKLKEIFGDLDAGALNNNLAALEKLREEAKGKAADAFDELKRKTDELNASWGHGADVALRNYLDGVQNVAKSSEQAMSNALSNMENDLVSFAMTQKLTFSNLANSIKADLARMFIRQNITGPLFGAMSGASGLGGIGELLSMPGKLDIAGIGIPSLGDIGKSLASFLPSFDVGSPYVPHDMIAQIHKGERIIPASENARASSNSPVSHTYIVNVAPGTPSDVRRAAGVGMREAAAMMDRARRYA